MKRLVNPADLRLGEISRGLGAPCHGQSRENAKSHDPTGTCHAPLPEGLLMDHTSVVVAHWLFTIRWADRIPIFHHGKLREEGQHQQLLSRGGIDSRLAQLQYSGALPWLQRCGRGINLAAFAGCEGSEPAAAL